MLHRKRSGVLTEEKGFIHQQLSGLFRCLYCSVLEEVEAIGELMPGLGMLLEWGELFPTVANTGRLHLKGVPFSKE